MKISPLKKRGSILITMLFMVSILALLVAAVSNDSMQNMRTISQSGRDTQAKYAAYAGLESSLNKLRRDPQFHGTQELTDRHGRYVSNLEGFEEFEFEVLVWNNTKDPEDTSSDDPADLDGPNGVVVKANTVHLVSTGRNVDRGEEVILLSMAGTARQVRPVFDDAAYARTKLSLSGGDSLVDAWDSVSGSYIGGSFPGDAEDGEGGHGGGGSNVHDYEATLGTDAVHGRTLRLTDGARLNGHYRVGPDVVEELAFGEDRGMPSGSDSVRYAVTTAEDPDHQIAGVEPPDGSTDDIGSKKVQLDTKTTEVPRFEAPYDEEDVAAAPIVDNEWTDKVDEDGNPITDYEGNVIRQRPAPVSLAPGGYESVSVGKDQTLELTAGVYFFRDDFNVNGGRVTTVGDGPSIVFCGKKATIVDGKINPNGRTSHLQLCFTDDIKDEDTLDDVAAAMQSIFGGQDLEQDARELIAPKLGGDEGRAGFSTLELRGDSEVYGSISGKNLVADLKGGEIFGSIMANVVKGNNAKIHQDLALKGSNLMTAGGWKLEGVHQVR